MAVRPLPAAIIAALMLALGAPASASEAPAEFSFDFETSTPGAPSDAALHIIYKDPENPEDPDGQSPPLTEVIIAAPPGTVFDGSAVPACTAGNAELMLLGRAACPEASRVGDGFASVVTTVGPPSEHIARITLFNYGEGIIELLEFLGGAVKVVDRAEFEDEGTMVLHPPVVPGFTEREFSLSYETLPAGAETPFLTTPPSCPASGQWTSRLTYTVTTGATYSVPSTQGCSQPAISGSPAP